MRRLALIAGAFALLGLFSLEALFAASAATESGCGLCHVPSRAAEDLSHSSHRGTDCSSCHKLPGVSGTVRYNLQAADNVVSWLLRRSASSAGQPAVASSCPRCHPGLSQRVVTARGVRMSHKEVMVSAEGEVVSTRLPCTRCHAQVAHDPVSGGVASLDAHSTCVGCHDGLTASKECVTCHTDGAVKAAGTTPSADPHPAGWGERHGMGDLSTCSVCHLSTFCQGCHKVPLPHDPTTYMYTHGKGAVSAGKACLSCHARASCDTCHKVPMPHPADYLQQHGKQAAERGSDVCIGCHSKDDCDTCHLRHIHPGVAQSVRDKLEAQSGAARSSVPTTSAASEGS